MVKLLVTKVNDDFSCLVENQVVAKNKGAKEYEVEYCEWLGKFYLADHVPVKPEPTKEEIQALRSDAYKAEVDPIMSEYTRKKTFNLFKEGEEELLLEKIYLKANEVKEYFPYPVEEVVVSKTETVDIVD